MHSLLLGVLMLGTLAGAADGEPPAVVPYAFKMMNLAEPFMPQFLKERKELPIVVAPFAEHVRGPAPDIDAVGATALRINAAGQREAVKEPKPVFQDGQPVNASVTEGAATWVGTNAGLYSVDAAGACKRHESYGVGGPLATRITALALDSKGTLWVGTPIGLSFRKSDATWGSLQGRQGLPIEDITALAVDKKDQVWIGTSKGTILCICRTQPDAKWFYRAGQKYLPGDRVASIAIAPEGTPAYFLTDNGVGRIDIVTTTLLQRAQTIEKRVNERHRRQGLVAACMLDNADNPTSHTIGDNDNDGLWTAYHVAAMSLCYGATKDPAARESAKQGMHALYMLQNASGTPGLVARSVLPAEIGKTKGEQWRPTADGTMYWKSDTSNDEIDGHYLAFYTYYEHIAKDDPAEKELLTKQLRALTDYIADNGYQLIDWTGKRTSWGFWDPTTLNDSPMHYVETGLNSLQILSFLKVSHHITGDAKYDRHYRELIEKHNYMNNVIVTKKAYPDSVNHSDDQLAWVAWYPILQLEKDLTLCRALYAGARRHYEFVKAEQPSFYILAYATIDPLYADVEGAVENLRQITTDRRLWACANSVRADVQVSKLANRFGKTVLSRVLPADERQFEKWNGDPYIPDGHGDGRVEDDGAAFLLPYWMGRYHGFIAEAQ